MVSHLCGGAVVVQEERDVLQRLPAAPTGDAAVAVRRRQVAVERAPVREVLSAHLRTTILNFHARPPSSKH